MIVWLIEHMRRKDTILFSDISTSPPLVNPMSDVCRQDIMSVNETAPWQTDFERKFIELEDLGRGRFGVVRKCQEILTGAEVAVKFVHRKRQSRDATQKEHEILAGLSHPHLVHSRGLFVTATSDAIVLNL